MLEGGHSALRLAYSAVTPEQAEEGVKRLAEALAGLSGRGSGKGPGEGPHEGAEGRAGAGAAAQRP